MSIGLVLTGGGARGAYQAGVIQAVVELAERRGAKAPFRVVSGASAGAVNASFLAAAADDLAAAAPKLAEFWASLRTDEIFRTDVLSLGRIALGWASDLALGKWRRRKATQSLLDTEPLRRLIRERVAFDRITGHLRSGIIDAFEVTAMDYRSSESVSFVMARQHPDRWERTRRRVVSTEIGLEHVMASAAIPLLFPPIGIGGRHYGDGCLRNPAPLSPAITLGAKRLLVVGVRHPKARSELNAGLDVKPTIGRVLSVLLNSVLMDAVEFDVERLARVNELVRAVPPEFRAGLTMREIDFLHLTPSIDLGALAAERFNALPDALRYLISGLGSRDEASELVSYLFFEPEYCGVLARLGYEDTKKRLPEIEALLFEHG
jgi:NTE family protein